MSEMKEQIEATRQDIPASDVIAEQAGTPTAIEVSVDASKAIARITAVAQVIQGCTKASIQRTNPKDWVKMGEGNYLQATGAQKIRPVWGIYYRDRQVSKEVYDNGAYGYIVTGKVGSKLLDTLYGEVVIEIEGGRNAADDFFTKHNRIPDPMDVRKAALANWEARAVTALLGMKNMSDEDLRKNGVDPTQIKGVTFEKGAEGGGKNDVDKTYISIPQRKRLFAIAKKAGVTEVHINTHLKLFYKVDSTDKIKRGAMYENLVSWAESGGKQVEPEGTQQDPEEGRGYDENS